MCLWPRATVKPSRKNSKGLQVTLRPKYVGETRKLAGALDFAQAQLAWEELLCVRSTTWRLGGRGGKLDNNSR